ncbi:DNA-binding transcriptional MerR regulator [Enterococcus sp. PF1-24]|uniref:MerR family transcriptional regulator n=1 Tax=unclassified Enterococcus TaxID=2608891 RepID=UPI0024735915|nr:MULTISPECIES: MerR family transcriptional regulator [unclassified Enterococcus]MDH6365542.1 DNA-binding transcriptional MerR regulator [Enterococcus sp. PFB1-1]MDH6402643.1 DNA-binding transcriptional MerR regulator [Enterococcus sp. PF1-24]
MFRIGEFSKLANITVKMLRHYDEIALLQPAYTQVSNGYRYYTAEQLSQANQINLYKNLGFALKDIKVILTEGDDSQLIADYFSSKESQLLEELAALQKRVELLEEVALKNQTQERSYHVIKKVLPSRLVLSLRKKVTDYNDEQQLWNELYATIQQYQLEPVYDGYTLAIYHDAEFAENLIDIEVQVTIAEKKELTGACQIFETALTEVISVTFAGSYQQIPQVNQALAFWLEQENAKMVGPMLNIFHVSPAQTDNPNEYVTEACYQILNKQD